MAIQCPSEACYSLCPWIVIWPRWVTWYCTYCSYSWDNMCASCATICSNLVESSWHMCITSGGSWANKACGSGTHARKSVTTSFTALKPWTKSSGFFPGNTGVLLWGIWVIFKTFTCSSPLLCGSVPWVGSFGEHWFFHGGQAPGFVDIMSPMSVACCNHKHSRTCLNISSGNPHLTWH